MLFQQAALRRRDAEIARLAARVEAASDLQPQALAARAQAQAESILQLHARLEEACSQLAAASAAAEHVETAEAAAHQAQEAQQVRTLTFSPK